MATHTSAVLDNQATSTGDIATLRTMLTAIRQAMEAVGFELTADTGQINESTWSVNLSTQNAYGGQQIFKVPSSDPNQAAMPIFFKNRYRTHSVTGLGLVVSPHFGIGSDGAGNLLTPWLPHNDTQWMQNSYGNTVLVRTVRTPLFGGLWILAADADGDNYSRTGAGFFFHRFHDVAGVANDDGFVALTFSGFHSYTETVQAGYMVLPGSTVQNAETLEHKAATDNVYEAAKSAWRGEHHPLTGHKGFIMPDLPGVGLDGADALHYGYLPILRDGYLPPLTGLLLYHTSHHKVGETFTVSRNGSTRTFMATNIVPNAVMRASSIGDWKLAILWE